MSKQDRISAADSSLGYLYQCRVGLVSAPFVVEHADLRAHARLQRDLDARLAPLHLDRLGADEPGRHVHEECDGSVGQPAETKRAVVAREGPLGTRRAVLQAYASRGDRSAPFGVLPASVPDTRPAVGHAGALGRHRAAGRCAWRARTQPRRRNWSKAAAGWTPGGRLERPGRCPRTCGPWPRACGCGLRLRWARQAATRASQRGRG